MATHGWQPPHTGNAGWRGDYWVLLVWVTCTLCWGQRIIIVDGRKEKCLHCLGVGEQLVLG